MADLVYQDQSAAGLLLTMLEGAVDETQFTVLQAEQYEDGGLAVRAGIIGASHFARVSFRDDVITEVLACTQVRTENARAVIGPLCAIRSNEIKLEIGGFHYRTFFSHHKCEQVERMKEMFQRGQGEITLMYEFPTDPQATSVYKPFTGVRVQQLGKSETWITTCHSYPQEGRAVLSTTHVTRR